MSCLKILAIAYACNPTRGSEFGVGWGWVQAIATGHDVTVITADFNAGDIERCLSKSHDQLSGAAPRFIYVKNRPWHYRPQGLWLRIEGSLAKPVMNLAYQDWLRCAFEEAIREVAQEKYDIVHLITYVGWRFPGDFYRIGIPFVWGPIGGMKNTPLRLLPLLGLKGALYYGGRNLINALQLRTLRGPRRALRAAGNGVIAATSEIQKELWNLFRVKSGVICEVGPPQLGARELTRRGDGEPLRICWSGTHLPGKALPLLLGAAAQLPQSLSFRIDILGDGPCNKAWRDIASGLKVDDRCYWHGWLSRDESLEVMGAAHVFVITSLKDLTSNVAVEAVSLGLPIVCLDHCGFADLVTAECGLKVYPGTRRQIIEDLKNALLRMFEDEPLRLSMARGALQRSRDYSWSSKMKELDKIYSSVVRTRDEAHGAVMAPAGKSRAQEC